MVFVAGMYVSGTPTGITPSSHAASHAAAGSDPLTLTAAQISDFGSANAGTATALQAARTINGTSFNGTADITITAAAGTLTGTTINATVVTSSLTSVGTIGTGVWQGTAIAIGYGGAPSGGTTGQALVKSSNTNYDYAWTTISGSGTVTGTGTDNHAMRWDGTGAAQDSNIVIADTTGAMTNSAALAGGNLLAFTNTSTTASSTGIYGAATGATGAVFGIVGTTSSSDNGAYGGYFNRGGTDNAGLCAMVIDVGEVSTPAAPPTGFSRVYAKSDNLLYYQTDGGSERKIAYADGTLAITSGKTLTASNTITFTATDGSTLAIGTGGTLGTAAYTAASAYLAVANNLSDVTAATALTNLGGTTVGQAIFTVANPGAIRFLRVNTDHTVTLLNGVDFRTAIAAGTGDVVGPSSATADSIAVFDSTTGKLVKVGSTLATITSGVLSANAIRSTTTLGLKDNDLTHYLLLTCNENLTADRTLSLLTGNANASLTVNGTCGITGSNTGDQTVPSEASQAEQESPSGSAYVSPRRQQFHPSAAKGWISFNGSGTIASRSSYNVSGITDNGAGTWNIQWDTDFSNGNYSVYCTAQNIVGTLVSIINVDSTDAPATTDVGVACYSWNGVSLPLYDSPYVFVAAFGDQ